MNYLLLSFQYIEAIACFFASFFFIVSSNTVRIDHNSLLLGRTLTGIIHGIISVTLLLHIADNSSQYFRRYMLWVYAFVTSIPLILIAFLFTFVMDGVNCQVTTGFIMMASSIFVLILMPLTYESIVYLIDTGKNDLKALGILIKLRNNTRQFIRHDFNEFRIMIVEDSQRGGNIFINGNLFPLILVLLLRLLNAILANNLLNVVFVSNVWNDYSSATYDISESVEEVTDSFNLTSTTPDLFNSTDLNFLNSTDWSTTTIETPTENVTDYNYTLITEFINVSDLFVTSFTSRLKDTFLDLYNTSDDFNVTDLSTEDIQPRDSIFIHTFYTFKKSPVAPEFILLFIFVGKLLFGIPFLCYAESSGIFRNRFFFKACIIIGILNLIFSIFVRVCFAYDDSSLLFTFYIVKLLNIIKISFILVAFGIDTIGYIELTESFSLTKRNGSIAFILVIEHIVNIITVYILFDYYPFYYNYVQAIIVIVISYSLLRYMPVNQLNLSLRNARDKYWAPD